MTQPSDRNLVDAHIRGDTEAFATLLRRYGPPVLGYLTKMTHNKDHAEDLFQETFRRVHQNAGQFRGEHIKPWLFKIATHTAINRYRKEKNTPAISLNQPLCTDGVHCATLQSSLAADTVEPGRQMELDEQRQLVRNSLMQLPEKQRAALVLSYYHKLNHSQIAEAMDCSVGTVKTHLFRALKKLRTLLPQPVGGMQ
ncbi:MAG: sigma-70 family RNA polymerase sigma factor [Phycisphaerae bacterium]|nr:sigma-70 family RNA polymerase sigma factor [Phycisphaerae bacterium]